MLASWLAFTAIIGAVSVLPVSGETVQSSKVMYVCNIHPHLGEISGLSLRNAPLVH